MCPLNHKSGLRLLNTHQWNSFMLHWPHAQWKGKKRCSWWTQWDEERRVWLIRNSDTVKWQEARQERQTGFGFHGPSHRCYCGNWNWLASQSCCVILFSAFPLFFYRSVLVLFPLPLFVQLRLSSLSLQHRSNFSLLLTQHTCSFFSPVVSWAQSFAIICFANPLLFGFLFLCRWMWG